MALNKILMIALGAAAMLIYTLLRRKQFPDVAVWKIPVLMVILTFAGVLGTLLLGYIENGVFGPTSFYGAVLFVPVLILPALLLKVKYSTLMDVCAGAECAMLAIMKIDCWQDGCCFGKQVQFLGFDFQFPSAIAEMINSIGLAILMVTVFYKFRNGSQYPIYMITYGATRFCLNLLRYVAPDQYILGLPQGLFWSLISMTIGAAWLAWIYKDKFQRNQKKVQKKKK